MERRRKKNHRRALWEVGWISGAVEIQENRGIRDERKGEEERSREGRQEEKLRGADFGVGFLARRKRGWREDWVGVNLHLKRCNVGGEIRNMEADDGRRRGRKMKRVSCLFNGRILRRRNGRNNAAVAGEESREDERETGEADEAGFETEEERRCLFLRMIRAHYQSASSAMMFSLQE